MQISLCLTRWTRLLRCTQLMILKQINFLSFTETQPTKQRWACFLTILVNAVHYLFRLLSGTCQRLVFKYDYSLVQQYSAWTLKSFANRSYVYCIQIELPPDVVCDVSPNVFLPQKSLLRVKLTLSSLHCSRASPRPFSHVAALLAVGICVHVSGQSFAVIHRNNEIYEMR